MHFSQICLLPLELEPPPHNYNGVIGQTRDMVVTFIWWVPLIYDQRARTASIRKIRYLGHIFECTKYGRVGYPCKKRYSQMQLRRVGPRSVGPPSRNQILVQRPLLSLDVKLEVAKAKVRTWEGKVEEQKNTVLKCMEFFLTLFKRVGGPFPQGKIRNFNRI